ncbi:MAG: arsenate reductase ArsC [Thermoplasmata archaeon]|nr:MAG: arsenate reductase ArsC [Thermoplasmata archaeon]
MKKILFVCVGNSCRSQMAEGFTRHRGGENIEVKSAGTKPAIAVSSKAQQVMAEEGIDISSQYPKGFSEEDLEWADRVILMGCGIECPNIGVGKDKVEDWGIDDPIGQPKEKYEEIRDEIKLKVKDLLERLHAPKPQWRRKY